MNTRIEELNQWLQKDCGLNDYHLHALAGDASLRRYYRLTSLQDSQIVMDAPPEKENCRPFVAVANSFQALGLNVPTVIKSDIEKGFLLLTDLGDVTFFNALSHQEADTLYKKAIDELLLLQTCTEIKNYELPYFDEVFMQRELDLFRDWFVIKHLQLPLSNKDKKMLDNTFSLLMQEISKQQKICVHRDYHSRNLMLLNNGSVGVLDFQDAVWGPISYDLVSLLKDCYIAWPKSARKKWVNYYYDKAMTLGVLKKVSEEKFSDDFDLMGIQRHLKAIGIFARLKYLFNKPNYIHDIPRTARYIVEALEKYPQFHLFNTWLKEVILDKIGEATINTDE